MHGGHGLERSFAKLRLHLHEQHHLERLELQLPGLASKLERLKLRRGLQHGLELEWHFVRADRLPGDHRYVLALRIQLRGHCKRRQLYRIEYDPRLYRLCDCLMQRRGLVDGCGVVRPVDACSCCDGGWRHDASQRCFAQHIHGRLDFVGGIEPRNLVRHSWRLGGRHELGRDRSRNFRRRSPATAQSCYAAATNTGGTMNSNAVAVTVTCPGSWYVDASTGKCAAWSPTPPSGVIPAPYPMGCDDSYTWTATSTTTGQTVWHRSIDGTGAKAPAQWTSQQTNPWTWNGFRWVEGAATAYTTTRLTNSGVQYCR